MTKTYREAQKRWREKNRDKVNEMKRQWNRRNPEKYREIHRRYYQKNREYCLQKSKEWAQRNPEKIRKAHQEWYRRNKKEINRKRRERWMLEKAFNTPAWKRKCERQRKYRLLHPEKWREQSRKYYRVKQERWKAMTSEEQHTALFGYAKERLKSMKINKMEA